jgi:hypothetical protein
LIQRDLVLPTELVGDLLPAGRDVVADLLAVMFASA